MCAGGKRELPKKNMDRPDEAHEDPARHQVNIFADYDSQYVLQRALRLHRLVQDPFYDLMNISPVSRVWMMRHMLFLHGHLRATYDRDLLQFFEALGTWRVVKYLQYKNAPEEMIKRWEELYPLNESERPGKSSPPENCPQE